MTLLEQEEKGRRRSEQRLLAVVLLHIVSNLSFLIVGCWVVSEQNNDPRFAVCEKTYHVRRFLTLTLAFNAISFSSYFIFSRPGCEEQARARATALLVLHLGFSVWGTAAWRRLEPKCEDAMGSKLVIFQHIAVVYNALYFTFLCGHEVVMNPDSDWTVMPVVLMHERVADPMWSSSSPPPVQPDPQPIYYQNQDDYQDVQNAPLQETEDKKWKSSDHIKTP